MFQRDSLSKVNEAKFLNPKAFCAFFLQTFRAFHYPNYRLWFYGQLISLFGTWMQATAQGFLMFELTHSSAYLGATAFAIGIPVWMFMLYAGTLADRISKRKLLVMAQLIMMTSAFLLAFLTYMKWIQPWHIIALAFVNGIGNAFDAPARQAFVRDLVDRTDLTNAIALNSVMFNTAAVVGPAVAGLTYAAWGAESCFLLNGVSYFAIIINLMMMKMPGRMQAAAHARSGELKEALVYVWREPTIRMMMLSISAISIFGLSYTTLFPAWAKIILHGDARTLGFLHSFRGAGSVIGALLMAMLAVSKAHFTIFKVAATVFPLSLLAFSLNSKLSGALFFLVFVGMSSMVLMNLANAMIQNIVTDQLRGRVMAIYSLMFFGIAPIGGLLIGLMAEKWGDRIAVTFCALSLGIFYTLFFLGTSSLAKSKSQES
jgi:MFS family permease